MGLGGFRRVQGLGGLAGLGGLGFRGWFRACGGGGEITLRLGVPCEFLMFAIGKESGTGTSS